MSRLCDECVVQSMPIASQSGSHCAAAPGALVSGSLVWSCPVLCDWQACLAPLCATLPDQALPSPQREVDRNQELLARIRQLQEREATAEEKMREQLERHRLCKQSLDAASQQLREREDGLASAREVSAGPCLGPRLTLIQMAVKKSACTHNSTW